MPTLAKSEIRNQLIAYLSESFPLFAADAADDTPIAEHGVDSLGLTNIVVHLEQSFSITIDDEEITRANLGSVETLVNFIDRKLNA